MTVGRLLNRERDYLFAIVPIAAVICLLCWCYVAVRPAHAWDDAEPEILNQSWRLADGRQLYPSIETPPYVHTAYPPVYLALVAVALRQTGLSYVPAKLVSFVSALAIGCALAMLARFGKRDRRLAWWALGVLFLLPAFLYNSARSHVQMLAVALSLFSFVLFLRKGNFSLVASALLAVLAVYTKQTQIALPIAMVAFLARSDFNRLVIYLGTLLAAGVPPLFWLQWRTGGLFLDHTVTLNRLSYSVSDIPLVLLHWAGPLFIFIWLAAADCWRRIRQRRPEAVDFYLMSVAVVMIIFSGRLGAHSQYVVEFCVVTVGVIVLSEFDPVFVARSRLIAWCQVLVLIVYCPFFIFVEEGRFGMASNRAAGQIYAKLKAVPGPVLSQQSSFSLFTNGEIPIQLFHFTALARAGLWDMGKLERQIDIRTFAWVVTEFPIESDQLSADDLERFTPEVVEALRKNYSRVEAITPYFIYRPASR